MRFYEEENCTICPNGKDDDCIRSAINLRIQVQSVTLFWLSFRRIELQDCLTTSDPSSPHPVL
ncbi:hypothetical protein KIN20_001334 [Parelaphostrongylus tenuis]|uniref:Uncharacterized protein n=1 Tax=Parelaphostrongylus tenuis TaxID=148309 RepID=A0AAD5LWV4_PARTN|nr:hypothetical protein KIN20_001334 [Parelaphostrongylus tenuis]